MYFINTVMLKTRFGLVFMILTGLLTPLMIPFWEPAKASDQSARWAYDTGIIS
jgi:hypothetical protein